MQEDNAASLEEIIASYSEWRDGHSRNIAIIRSVLAIVSILASSRLIWMINKSSARLSNPYHRILFGMSIADIIYSLSFSLFNVMAPTDDAYMVWNPKGNVATCSFQGFLLFLGAGSGLLYSCSLNLYYLALVKYHKTESYIKRTIEPYLHGVPILYAVIFSITLTATKNFNDNGNGLCNAPVYNLRHCAEYEDGQIPEGFEIPCGRGRDGAVLLYYLVVFITMFIVPIVVGVSLGMIYRAVLREEKKIARYGAGAFTASAAGARQSCAGDNADDRVGDPRKSRFSVGMSSALSRLGTARPASRHPPASNQDRSKNSRAVLHKALAYSSAYFLTWSFSIVLSIFTIVGVEPPVVLRYLSTVFGCLQGLFNFLIFIQPKVMKAKSKGKTNWCRAFAEACWSTGGSASGRASGEGTGRQTKRITRITPSRPLTPTKEEEEKSAEEKSATRAHETPEAV